MEIILAWIIRKLVTFYWQRYPFMTYSWGVDDYVDLHIISEESYKNRHRFGTREDKYESRGKDR